MLLRKNLEMNAMNNAFFILFFSVSLTACVTKQQFLSTNYQQGKLLFQHENYHQAFNKLAPVAKAGYADAEYAIGYMYFYGKGIVEDKKLARYWISKAAHQGQAAAIQALKQI